MDFDYAYLCQGLGHLTGLEARIYQGDTLFAHYVNFEFKPDIAGLIQEEIHEKSDNAFYIETESLLIFGIVKCKRDHIMLVLGPTSQAHPAQNECISMLHMLGESHTRLEELQEYFENMVPYPFENFLEIVCFVNYALNGEKLSVANLVAKESDDCLLQEAAGAVDRSPAEIAENPHNTFQAEKLMLSYVTTGNMEAIQTFIRQPPTGQIGLLAHNELRQRKNLIIVAATLISRAAILGGMSAKVALVLSDWYIQKAELLKSGKDLTALNMEMLLDYTRRVEQIKLGTDSPRLSRKIMRYICKNMSEKNTTADLAKQFNMSRTYLCEQFKAETGKTIGDFITSVKVEEAKRLLTGTDISIAEISDFLAFSSQSYFQNVFKKEVGKTPKQYRDGT